MEQAFTNSITVAQFVDEGSYQAPIRSFIDMHRLTSNGDR
jgi:hypothetical protein